MHSRRNTIRVGQRIQDGQPHVGYRKLSKYAAIHKLDHGMNCGLRMHHHLHPAGWQVEQTTSLDDLKSLVHQSRRVDCDALAHFPGGMVQGLRYCDRRKLRLWCVKKWSSGGS